MKTSLHRFYLKLKAYCKTCGTGKKPHKAKGLCTTCYIREYKRSKAISKNKTY